MKTSTLKIFAIAVLFILSSKPIFAQNKAQTKISGLLIDDTGKALDFGTVSLMKATDSTVVKGTLSNESGHYTFDLIKPGSYFVKATNIGYQNAFSTVFKIDSVSTDYTLPDLKLNQQSSTLKTVNITATKPLIERKVDKTVMNLSLIHI